VRGAALTELAFLYAIRTSYGAGIATPLAVPPSRIESMAKGWVGRLMVSSTCRRIQKRCGRDTGPSPGDEIAASP